MAVDNTTLRKKTLPKVLLLCGLIIALAFFAIFLLRNRQQEAQELTFPEYVEKQSQIENYETIDISFVDSRAPGLTAWLADGPIRRSFGLSVVDELKDDQAMLFVFDGPGVYPFWMKDMKFAIDILWLDENREVVFIKESAQVEDYPDSYDPEVSAQYVLEVVDGFVQKYEIQVGDVVDL